MTSTFEYVFRYLDTADSTVKTTVTTVNDFSLTGIGTADADSVTLIRGPPVRDFLIVEGSAEFQGDVVFEGNVDMSGATVQLTLQGLSNTDLPGETTGNLLIYNGTDWTNLATGSDQQVLIYDPSQTNNATWTNRADIINVLDNGTTTTGSPFNELNFIGYDLSQNGPSTLDITPDPTFSNYSMTFTDNDYVVLSTDKYIVVDTVASSASVTITLPSASSKRELTIIDGTGEASEKPIVVVPDGVETIIGHGSVSINENYNSISVIADTTNLRWYII